MGSPSLVSIGILEPSEFSKLLMNTDWFAFHLFAKESYPSLFSHSNLQGHSCPYHSRWKVKRGNAVQDVLPHFFLRPDLKSSGL